MFQLVGQTEPHTQEAAEQGVVAVADTGADLCQNHARASACNRHADTTVGREKRSCQRRSGAGIHACMGWGAGMHMDVWGGGRHTCMDGTGAGIHMNVWGGGTRLSNHNRNQDTRKSHQRSINSIPVVI